jgi:hypothetical protein
LGLTRQKRRWATSYAGAIFLAGANYFSEKLFPAKNIEIAKDLVPSNRLNLKLV